MSKQTTKNGKPEGTSPSSLPLLYKQPSVLDKTRHAQASILQGNNFSFAKNINSVALNTIEFIEASKTYPIVFTATENPMPVVIVGFEQQNYFIRPDNSWQEGAYIPAYIRQYPFVFMEQAKEKRFYLCVDEASPTYSATAKDGANKLYNDKNEPTEFTNNALKFCTSFYQHHLITRNFCADLQEHKLLQPYQSEVTLATGKKAKLSGFQMIDEKALNMLSNKSYLALREKGWIPFIYSSLSSVSNWKKLADMEAQSK